MGKLLGIARFMWVVAVKLGFAHSAEDLLIAKTGILFSSALAGVSGFVWLFLISKNDT